jgi:hypothetical protein
MDAHVGSVGRKEGHLALKAVGHWWPGMRNNSKAFG